MDALLKVDHLSVTFSAYNGDVHAVRDVSFSVGTGETLAIVGESGCGKSVTAKAILRLLDRTSAVISPEAVAEYNGENLLRLPKHSLNRIRGGEIGYVFQDAMTSLDPTMPLGRQMAETIRRHRKCTKAQAKARTIELFHLAELPEPEALLSRYPHEISGGQRQRVMIAMALSCDPKLLIADEPTTALDVTTQAEILDLLHRLQAKLGMAVILITHDLGLVAGIADRVLVMYGGSIVEHGSVDEIFYHPKHPYTAALLQAQPGRNPKRSGPLPAIPGAPPDLRLAWKGCAFAPRCRYAMPVCKKAPPTEVDGSACWLMDRRAPSVTLSGGITC